MGITVGVYVCVRVCVQSIQSVMHFSTESWTNDHKNTRRKKVHTLVIAAVVIVVVAVAECFASPHFCSICCETQFRWNV